MIIEIQVLNVLGFKKRVLYNAAKAFSTQLKVEDDYSLLNPVIALTITDFVMFDHSDKVFSYYCLKEKTDLTDYSDDIELVFVELPKFNKGIDELATLGDKWIYFLKEASHLESVPAPLEQEPAIQNAFEVARQSQLTQEEIDILDRQAMFIHDSRNAVRLSLQQGIEQGRRATQIEIARTLLGQMSSAEIARITGLRESDVEDMRQQ